MNANSTAPVWMTRGTGFNSTLIARPLAFRGFGAGRVARTGGGGGGCTQGCWGWSQTVQCNKNKAQTECADHKSCGAGFEETNPLIAWRLYNERQRPVPFVCELIKVNLSKAVTQPLQIKCIATEGFYCISQDNNCICSNKQLLCSWCGGNVPSHRLPYRLLTGFESLVWNMSEQLLHFASPQWFSRLPS